MDQVGISEDRLQTFRGRNAREVFSNVRDALGPDAVIVKQHNGPGYVEIVASADFPVNVQTDPQGCCPLHSAAWAGHVEAMEVLLEHGARRDLRNYRGETPRETALRQGQHAAAAMFAKG